MHAFSTARRNFGKVDAFLSRDQKKPAKTFESGRFSLMRLTLWVHMDQEGSPVSAVLISVSTYKAMTENNIFCRTTGRTDAN